MACCSSFRLLFLWFFLFFCFLSVQPSPVFVFLCFFLVSPICSVLLCGFCVFYLHSLSSVRLFFSFFSLSSPGLYLCFLPPGSFGFPLVPWFVPFSSSSLCFFFFFFLVSLYILSVHPLLRKKTMVIKAWDVAGWMEAPSSVFSRFRLCVRLVCLSWFCFSSVLPLCFLSLAFYSQRKPCRYPDSKVTVIAGVMAMHRWTSVFFGSGEEDEQRWC
jgi:hypothetical protein